MVFGGGRRCTGAAATATISGIVTGVNGVTFNLPAGSGYVTAPLVTFTGGGGSGAYGIGVLSAGSIVGVDMLSGGSGYTNAAGITVNFVPAAARAASPRPARSTAGQVTANVMITAVTGVTMTNPGMVAFISAPTVSFAGGTTGMVAGANVISTTGGAGYSSASPPAVTFSASPTGVTATGTAIVNASGVVTGITITNPGTGYVAVPTVTIAAGATTATATAYLGVATTPGNPVFSGGLALNGATRNFQAADVGTTPGLNVTSVISGTAGFGITKLGDGTVTLNPIADNTFLGTTTVQEGTLLLGTTTPGVTVLPGNVQIGDLVGTSPTGIGGVGQDVLRFAPGSTNSANAIAGTVSISNTGLFELYNAGTAPVTIGTLTMVGGILNIPANTTLALAGSVFGQFNADDLGEVSPAGAAVPGAAVITGTGSLSLGGSTRTFDVQAGQAGADMTVTPTIINGSAAAGLTKVDSGKLELFGNNTYSGTTTDSAGTLLIDGTQTGSAVAVGASATLAGIGTTGAITNTSGIVSPGDPATGIGTLSSSGSGANMSSGGTLTTQIVGANAAAISADMLNVTGPLVLGGSSMLTLDLSGLTTTSVAEVPIIAYSGALTGQFTNLTLINPHNFTVGLDYSTAGIIKVSIAATATQFVVSPSTSTPTAGAAFSVTVTAEDASGDTVAAYAGPVNLTSTDPLVPSLGSPTSATNGVFTFSGPGVVEDTAGPQTLMAFNGSTFAASSLQGTAAITVQPTSAPVVFVPGSINLANETNFAVSGTDTSAPANATVTVTVSDGIHIAVTGTGTVNGLGNWTVIGLNLSSLNDGANNITYTATSASSGSNTGTATGSKDTVAPPTASVTSPSSGSIFRAATAGEFQRQRVRQLRRQRPECQQHHVHPAAQHRQFLLERFDLAVGRHHPGRDQPGDDGEHDGELDQQHHAADLGLAARRHLHDSGDGHRPGGQPIHRQRRQLRPG